MITTEYGTCEAFVKDLLTHNLITNTHLPGLHDFLRKHPKAGPRELAKHCVEQELITRLQADYVLKGEAQELTLWVYTLTEVLRSDGLGSIYKARCKTDKNFYAVQTFPRRNVTGVPKVAKDLKAFKEFRHPAVVPIVQVGTAGERHYLVWPHVEGGESLEDRVKRVKRLPPRETARFALRAARGLQACHERGLFHGLLKPSDLFIDEGNKIGIQNFGIGYLLKFARGESLLNTLNASQQMANSIECASPESILDATNRTPLGDQYSLGCVLYYCLTGQFPFPKGNQAHKMMAHQFEEPTAIRDLSPQVPEALADVVARMMGKVPEERFASMAEVAEAMRAAFSRPSDPASSDKNLSTDGDSFRKTGPSSTDKASGKPASSVLAPPAQDQSVPEQSTGASHGLLIGLGAAAGVVLALLAAWLIAK
jgi:serine/threonine-protein kinase